MTPIEMLERLEKLREGTEDVLCSSCKEGKMMPVGDRKVTHCFVCSKCGNRINID